MVDEIKNVQIFISFLTVKNTTFGPLLLQQYASWHQEKASSYGTDVIRSAGNKFYGRKVLTYDLRRRENYFIIANMAHRRLAWSHKNEVGIILSGTISLHAYERAVSGVRRMVKSSPLW